MKNRPAVLITLATGASLLVATAGLGYLMTYTWTGAANGTNSAPAGARDPNGLPDSEDPAPRDGQTSRNWSDYPGARSSPVRGPISVSNGAVFRHRHPTS